jgi:hypothetical protein
MEPGIRNGLLVVGALVLVVLALPPEKPARTQPHAIQTAASDAALMTRLAACNAAHEAVRGRLKAPATASFPSCAGAEHEIRATPDGKTVWVFGYVDAENEMGAKLRRQFGVEMTKAASSPAPRFTPVKVEIQR